MKPINDERFYELAMKSIARQCTAEDEAELQFALGENPARVPELAQLHTQAKVAKELLALVAATEATGPKLPASARARLRKHVAAVYGEPQPAPEPAAGRTAKGDPGPRIIDAAVDAAGHLVDWVRLRDTRPMMMALEVPPKPLTPFNWYKFFFFSLVALVLVGAGALLGITCRPIPAEKTPKQENQPPEVQRPVGRIAPPTVVENAKPQD